MRSSGALNDRRIYFVFQFGKLQAMPNGKRRAGEGRVFSKSLANRGLGRVWDATVFEGRQRSLNKIDGDCAASDWQTKRA